MIKANELRIGNWFRHNNTFGKEEMQFEYEFIKLGELIGDEFPQFDPIPLTRAILVKAGFEREVRGSKDAFDGEEIVYFNNGIDIYDNSNDGEGFAYATYTRYPGRGFKSGCSVKSLHHLQNLYFALTGTELNISL